MMLFLQEHIPQKTPTCPSRQHYGGKWGFVLLLKFADSITADEAQDRKKKKKEKQWWCNFRGLAAFLF